MSELDGPFTVGLNFLQKIGFYVTRELEVLRQRLRARKLCISSIRMGFLKSPLLPINQGRQQSQEIIMVSTTANCENFSDVIWTDECSVIIDRKRKSYRRSIQA